MMDLRARIESCFARRKTEDDKFVYVYLPTGEEGVGGRGALEAFANDTAAFETFVTKYKDPLVDFDGFCYEVKGKLFKVKYESGEEPENFETAGSAVKDGDEESEDVDNDNDNKGARFPSEVTAMDLKKTIIMRTDTKEPEKMKQFLERQPGVESVSQLEWHVPNRYRHQHVNSVNFKMQFTDVATAAAFNPKALTCTVGKLIKAGTQLDSFRLRPLQHLKKTLGNRFWFVKKYITVSDPDEIKREVALHCRGPYTNVDKLKEYLTANGVEFERVRALTTHLMYGQMKQSTMFILFKTQDAAINFLGGNLKMMGMSLNADIVSQLKIHQDRLCSQTQLHGDAKMFKERANANTIYVWLYPEVKKKLEHISSLFADGDLCEHVELPECMSALLDPDHQAQPVLILTYKTAEKMALIEERVDRYNSNISHREFIYLLKNNEIQNKKRVFPKAGELFCSPEEYKEMCTITDDSITLGKFDKPKGSLSGAELLMSDGGTVSRPPTELGDWVLAMLNKPAGCKVKWCGPDAQEIGRYFFENHRNVVEIKMHNSADIVYVRFATQDDALIFATLQYALFLGVRIDRYWFPESKHCRNENLREVLKANARDASNMQYQTVVNKDGMSVNVGDDWSKIGMTLTNFREKTINKILFEQLSNALGCPLEKIERGIWENKSGDVAGKAGEWAVNVMFKLPEEEVNRLVSLLNATGFFSTGARIQAVFYRQPPAKNATKKKIQKRGSEQFGNSPVDKRPRFFGGPGQGGPRGGAGGMGPRPPYGAGPRGPYPPPHPMGWIRYPGHY